MKKNWWEKVAIEAQAAADRKDTKSLYSIIREVFGPSQATIAPLRSKDGSELLKDAFSIQQRWVEHCSELLMRPSSAVDMNVVNQVEQLPIVPEMDVKPTLSEIAESVKKLNSGKASGLDGLPAEVLKAGGDRMSEMLYRIIQHCWPDEKVPHEWIDAILESIYKSGPRDECGNFCGISLLSVVSKVLARILLHRSNKHITPHAISESQC